MNAILVDMYSTVIPAAPFVIAAYCLAWVALFVFIAIVARALRKSEAQIAVLEEELDIRDEDLS